MNQTYLKYGLAAAAVIVVLYALMKGGTSSAQSPSGGGAVAVDVQYQASADRASDTAARSSAFSELVGLTGLIAQDQSDLAASQDANRTARSIAAGDETTTRYGLDIAKQIEALRIQAQREMAEFQAFSVTAAAESFRNKGNDRMQGYLNALTSIWGTSPSYAPERRNAFAENTNAVANAVSAFFGGGVR